MNQPEQPGLSLSDGLALSGMTYHELWFGQTSMGGTADPIEVEAYVLGLLAADWYQHNMLAQAINEHFIDRGGDHPVAYVAAR